jgi:outer membrane protein
MKRLIYKISIVFALLMFLNTTTNAQQRIAVIDTKFILEKLPDYKKAQEQLDAQSETWQKEIETLQVQVKEMEKNYEAEQIMLSEELRKKREAEILNKNKELLDLQRKRFGFEGDLFKKRAELVKPIQDKVYAAIEKLAKSGNYDLILDKSAGITVIFADPKLDKSEQVLQSLGVK